MNIFEFVLYVVVAGFAGVLGQAIAGYTRKGFLVSIALGFIGALLGTWIAGLLGLSHLLEIRIGDQAFPLIWSILGAALFVAVIGAITRRRCGEPVPHA